MNTFRIIKVVLCLLLVQFLAMSGVAQDKSPPSIVDSEISSNELIIKMIDESPILVYLYILDNKGKEVKHTISGQYSNNKIADVDFKAAGTLYLLKQNMQGLKPGTYFVTSHIIPWTLRHDISC